MSTCPVIHGEEGPKLDFGGTTPYEDYVHASVLHTLQKQASDDPREMSFLVITQIMELYFGLLVFEWGGRRSGSCGPTTCARPCAPCAAASCTCTASAPRGGRSPG